MYAFAVYNKKMNCVELWKEMPTYDSENEIWCGDSYLCSWVFPEVSMEVLDMVRLHGPLLVAVGISFNYCASPSEVQEAMQYAPGLFNGQKVNNV